MKVRLEVLVSASIKRKKPWRRIVWLGKEKESLFLLDDNRVSVLYVPSGKTKRNIPKLSNLLSETVCLTPAPNGLYLVGVQSSGEVFLWQKDKDELKTIVGLASLLVDGDVTPRDGCAVFPSPDCSQLLLVLGKQHIFLWHRESHVDDSKNNTLLGKWSRVTSSNKIHTPSPNCAEVSMHATFTYTEVLGYCCQLSTVFNKQTDLCVSSLLIRFSPNPDVASSPIQTTSTVTSTWTCLSKPLRAIQPGWEPISLRGAYTCQYSHDGQILAVGVNQKSPRHTGVLFMSTFIEDAMLVSDLRGCGLKDPGNKRGRQYWISDMTWTSDNLFLAVILCNGSAGLVSRLGEPVVIFSKGSSVELGPAYFLTFSPLISVQSDKKQEGDGHDLNPSANSETDPFHQRFSVSSHPALPILLYSDGYIVTIGQLPSELSPMLFMRDLVLESSSHLREIAEIHCLDLTLANAYNLPAGELESVRMPAHRGKHSRPPKKDDFHYSFEEPSMSLNETLDSEISFALGAHESVKKQLGAVHNMSSGKIIFGEHDVLLGMEESFLNEPDSTLKTLQLAKKNLFSVWKLAASSTELWSANMDKILNHAVHNIIKLFSLVLDCSQIKDLLDEATDQFGISPAVHTASLFKMVSLYKQLLDLLQFDCQQHHLLAHVLQLSHKTLHTILVSAGLCQSDPRIKTLTGCFTLLKFTESSMEHAYVSLPKRIQSVYLSSRTVVREEEKVNQNGAENLQTDIQLGKRLTATWKLLYKSVTNFIGMNDGAPADVRQAWALKSAIEQRYLEIDVDIPSAPAATINNGERLSLDGKHTMAINAWKDQLKQFKEIGSMENASRLFHSLLYTYILRNDLIAAIAFVDDLIIKTNPDIACDLDPHKKVAGHNLKSSVLTVVTSTLKTQAMHDPDLMPCIKNKAIRKVVQSMARFMAAYFSNQMIFILPPHNPTPLPAVHFETSSANNHIIPKYHEDIAAIVRHQKLDSVWTVERTLEYLLLTGLACEAVWFADRVGDWKAAYQLSVSHLLHRQLAPSVYERPKKPLSLPEWLTPDAIMKRKLERLVKDDLTLTNESSDLSHLTQILRDISLSGVMGFVEVGSWLLEQLVAKLKSLVKQFSPLVTKDFYLPAPPVYLHQPTKSEQKHHSEEAEEEIMRREKASSIIQLALCVMNATHLSVSAIQWYANALSEAQKQASQFKVNIEGPCVDLPDVLYQFSEAGSASVTFPHPSEDESVLSVQCSFRDLCSLVWLLHTRDKLSLALRSREKYLSLGVDISNSEHWLRESFVTLQYAVHMVTFSRFLSDEASIYKVVLSLLLDFPSTEDIANILAEYMYDLENLHPEVQERLDRLLNTWQGLILNPEASGKPFGEVDDKGHKLATIPSSSPRGKSLSIYFHRQCMIMDKVLKKKRQSFGSYEEFVFTGVKDESRKTSYQLNIGSRPFESKKSYIEFLDTFVAIGFSNVLESETDKISTANLPFLRAFSEKIVKREMIHFVEKVSGSNRRKHQGLSVLSGASQALARASSQESVYSSNIKTQDSPRTVGSMPGRSSGHERINVKGEKEHRGKAGRHGGLFRGMSMVDSPLKRSYAPVRRYESEPFLDDLDSFDEQEAQPTYQTNRSQQNVADIVSRYRQPEENIYHGHATRDQGKPEWSLTVSFGKKYTAMQQVVEWLEVWGNKSHDLGIPGHDEILDITPQIKIQIPAQLIILSLWLLENKYSRSHADEQKPERFMRSRRSRRLNQSQFRSQSLSPPERHAGTSPVEPESTHLSKKKVQQIESQQAPVKGQRGQRRTKADKTKVPDGLNLKLSLDQDQIIVAYTQLLDEPDDSSSIDVSSLASDELDADLKTTLNAIRRTGTVSTLKENSNLNHTLLPKEDSLKKLDPTFPQSNDLSTPVKQIPLNADHITASLSPALSSHKGAQNQTSSKYIAQSKGTSLPSEQPSQNRSQDSIANQLQGVIRNELQKIMEVQHHNMLALMGALVDKTSPGNPAPVTPQPTYSVSKSSPQKHQQQNVGSPKRSKRYIHTQTQTSSNQHHQSHHDNRWNQEEMSETELGSTQTHFSMTQPRRRQEGRSGYMREALTELQNLQHETKQTFLEPVPKNLIEYLFPVQEKEVYFTIIPTGDQDAEQHMRCLRQGQQTKAAKTLLHLHKMVLDKTDCNRADWFRISSVEDVKFHVPGRKLPSSIMDSHVVYTAYNYPQHSIPSRPQHAYHSEETNTKDVNMFHYLGPPGKSHIQFPYLPFQAWTENQQPPPFHGLGVPRLPLLYISKSQDPEYPFKNLRRFLPQVPPPHPQPIQHFFPAPPPVTQPSFSFFTPPPQLQRLQPPPYEQPLHLLTASAGDGPPPFFPLLRILSPGSVSSDAGQLNQREKVEQTRQKLLSQFHKQVLQNKENTDNHILANQMLHFQASEEMESARSDKSRMSAERKPDKELQSELVEDQQRAAQEQGRVEVADASTSDTQINQGFALPRGVFNSYLQLGEQLIGPEVNETNAGFQLRMAQAMQIQAEKRIRAMMDFTTVTQDPAAQGARTAEAATSFSRDTGVDPIQEALDEYNFKRHNNLIPPDIFMGLRFGDQDAQSGVEPRSPSSAPGRGRSYLNVVDIRASSVMRDIPEREEKPTPLVDQDNLDTAILTSERTAQQIGALEETLRQKFAPRSGVKTVPSYDAVTVKLFDQLRASKDNLMSVAIMPRSSVTQPKAAMIRRLQDMSDQMKVIDEMSQNIEREYQSSHLLLRTIQDINDSVQRSRSSSPIRSGGQKFKKEPSHFADEEEEDDEKKTSRQDSPDLPALKTSAKSPQVSARSRSTINSRSGERIIETENELTRLISEVLAQEGADLQSAGFSQQMAEQLERDAREQIQISSKMPGSKLRDKLVNVKQTDKHGKSWTPYEREELKAWMTQKFHQRQEEYMKRRNELIEREPKPFRSRSTVTKLDLKSIEERSEKRISLVSEFMNQRLIEAEHLMGSIIVDKPEIPWGSGTSADTRRRNQSRSPGRSGSSFSPAQLNVSRRSRSPGTRKVHEATWTYKTAPESRSAYRPDISHMSRDVSPVKSILKSSRDLRSSSTDLYLDQQVLASISEGGGTDSSADLINYAKKVLETDNNDSLSPGASFERISVHKPMPQSAIPSERNLQVAGKIQKTKEKSFADVVKMQRPEATRRWNDINRRRKLQEENEKETALQEGLAKSAAPQNPNLLKDKAKDYGSKHIPGFSPRQAVPRRVKTYSERLQEMRPPKQYSTPTAKDSSGRPLSTFRSNVPPGPSHRPQRYADQLQNQKSKAQSIQQFLQAKNTGKKMPMMMRTFLKSHGPKHKPKTYAEQLQELNPHPHKENLPKRAMQSTVTLQGPIHRSQARTRPYSNPYSEVDYEELASVFSDWDVDENVRNIIYGGLTPASSVTFMQMNDIEMSESGGDHRRLAPSENQSDYFDVVMQGRANGRLDAGDEFGNDDYLSSVDIQEIERIAELASVGSGSVLSVIDWDAVENLIKDV